MPSFAFGNLFRTAAAKRCASECRILSIFESLLVFAIREIIRRKFYFLKPLNKQTSPLYHKKMLDIKLLREEPEKVKSAIKLKGADPKLVDNFLELDGGWRRITAELDGLRGEQRELSNERDIDAAKGVKDKIKVKEEELSGLEKERSSAWLKIPNLSSDDTPIGNDESSNKVLRSWGEPRKFSAQGGSAPGGDFEPKDHLELGESLGIIDVKKRSEEHT